MFNVDLRECWPAAARFVEPGKPLDIAHCLISSDTPIQSKTQNESYIHCVLKQYTNQLSMIILTIHVLSQLQVEQWRGKVFQRLTFYHCATQPTG